MLGERKRDVGRAKSPADLTRSASEVVLSTIVDSILGSEFYPFLMISLELSQCGWSPVPSYSTYSVVATAFFTSRNVPGGKRSKETREILAGPMPRTAATSTSVPFPSLDSRIDCYCRYHTSCSTHNFKGEFRQIASVEAIYRTFASWRFF